MPAVLRHQGVRVQGKGGSNQDWEDMSEVDRAVTACTYLHPDQVRNVLLHLRVFFHIQQTEGEFHDKPRHLQVGTKLVAPTTFQLLWLGFGGAQLLPESQQSPG